MPLRLRSGRKRASRRVACGCLVDCSSRRSAADTPTRRGSVGLGLSRPRVPSSARGRAGQAACPPGARLAPVPMRVVNTCRSHTGMPLSLSGHALRPADRPGLPLALASPAHPNKCFFFLKKCFSEQNVYVPCLVHYSVDENEGRGRGRTGTRFPAALTSTGPGLESRRSQSTWWWSAAAGRLLSAAYLTQ